MANGGWKAANTLSHSPYCWEELSLSGPALRMVEGIEAEELTQEFVVADVGRYFRIAQVP